MDCVDPIFGAARRQRKKTSWKLPATTSVSDYIRRLEEAYRAAHPNLPSESRDCLLFYQMQEGVIDRLARAPQVSGALHYTQLCQSALFEERRLAMLQVRGRRADLVSRTNAVPTMPSSTAYSSRLPQPGQPQQRRRSSHSKLVGHLSASIVNSRVMLVDNALNALQKAQRLRLGLRQRTPCQLIVPVRCRQIYSVSS